MQRMRQGRWRARTRAFAAHPSVPGGLPAGDCPPPPASCRNEYPRRNSAPVDRITFGITAFDRPEHLQRLVVSIGHFHPGARVVVADNGRQRPELPEWVELIALPYDVGLSAARNALIDRLDREFLVLLEDDFELTGETRLEHWIDVLDHDACHSPQVSTILPSPSITASSINEFDC